MIQKIFTLLLLGCLFTATPYYSFAQQGNTTSKVEALKKLEALDPFKMNPVVGMSFDPSKGEALYFEDGKIINFEKFQSYIGRTEKDYIVIPYVNPTDKEKIVAMLVRKATASEMEQMKGFMEGQIASQKTYASEAGDPTDPSSMQAIKFDPSLKAAGYIKGLKKMGKSRMTMMNIGRVAIFDTKGNLIPLSEGKEAFERYNKYMVTPELASDTYIDEDDVIRAVVFREATPEERKNRQNVAGSVFSTSVGGAGDGGGTTNAMEKKAESTSSPVSITLGSNGVTVSNVGVKKKFGVGSDAKVFKAVDINGNTVDLASFKGKKTVVLNFWFVACHSCVEEMPELNKLVADMKGKDVEFISICLDKQEAAEAFLKKTQFDYRCIPNGQGIANQYRVMAYPVHVVINKKGEIVLEQLSFDPSLMNRIKAEINKN
jgi:peroxiredoxin